MQTTMPPITLEDVARWSPDRMKEIGEMLSVSNDYFHELLRDYKPEPWTRWRRFRYWFGFKIVDLGCTIMGNDAPHLD